jgi:hypothetical protein
VVRYGVRQWTASAGAKARGDELQGYVKERGSVNWVAAGVSRAVLHAVTMETACVLKNASFRLLTDEVTKATKFRSNSAV